MTFSNTFGDILFDSSAFSPIKAENVKNVNKRKQDFKKAKLTKKEHKKFVQNLHRIQSLKVQISVGMKKKKRTKTNPVFFMIHFITKKGEYKSVFVLEKMMNSVLIYRRKVRTNSFLSFLYMKRRQNPY